MVILATLIGTGFYLGSRTGMFYEVQALFWQYYYKLSPVETPYASADDWARKNLDKVIDIQKGRRWGAVYRLPVDIDPADTQAVYQYELKTRSLYFLQQQNNVQEGDWASTFLLATMPPDIRFAQFFRVYSYNFYMGDYMGALLNMDAENPDHQALAKRFHFPTPQRLAKWKSGKAIKIAFKHFADEVNSQIIKDHKRRIAIFSKKADEIKRVTGINFKIISSPFHTENTRALFDKVGADIIISSSYKSVFADFRNGPIVHIAPALRHGMGYVLLDGGGNIRKAFCEVGPASGIPQASVEREAQVCLAQAMGLVMLDDRGRGSTITQEKIAKEYKLLELLYRDDIKSGMTEDEVRKLFKNLSAGK
ncbi:MAG: hypothetical protein D8M28_00750 [Proteobacteria bacterium]|nr:hypothetical protein [Pseudomonadota bacterium]